MNKQEIQERMKFAKECVEHETEYKKEAYAAILTATLLTQLPNQTSQATQLQSTHKGTSSKPLSAKEFLIEKSPQSNVQKAICLAYYEEQHKGKKSWTVRDLVEAFRSAKETVPGNPSDVILQCRTKGWVMENNDGYTLTNKGEQQVTVGFSKEKN